MEQDEWDKALPEEKSNAVKYREDLFINIVHHVARSNAIVKSQQRGEPELTFDEKCDILTDLLNEKPAVFLSRFKGHLILNDLKYFEQLRDNFEIDFYLKEAENLLDAKQNQRTQSNRRYEYLRQMKTSNCEYFSDKEMRRKCPLLFEEFIGQYMTHEEREELHSSSTDGNTSGALSQFIFDRMDEEAIQLKQAFEMFQEEDQMEEEEEEEEDSEEEEEILKNEERKEKITAKEKERLRVEFMSMMEDRFIEGKDNEFDYSKVDENQDYDPIVDRQLDEEEAYFDSEEPYRFTEEDDKEMDTVDNYTFSCHVPVT